MYAKKYLRATKLEITKGLNISLLAKQVNLKLLITPLNNSSNKSYRRLSSLITASLTAEMQMLSSTIQLKLPSNKTKAECTIKCNRKSSTTTTLMKKWKLSQTQILTSLTLFLWRKEMWLKLYQQATRVTQVCVDSKSLVVVFYLPRVRVLKYRKTHLMKITLKSLKIRELSLSF